MMLDFDSALIHLLENTQDLPKPATCKIEITQALGLVTADTTLAATPAPPFDNSAMDGVAFRASDLSLNLTLPLSQHIFAGKAAHPLKAGTAARIYTGGMIPEGADSVEIQENCKITETSVSFLKAPPKGRHIRRAGEDFAQNSEIMTSGELLKPKHIGLLAQAGKDQVLAYQPLRVALIVSGDELATPGTPLAPGQIYNSNQPLLSAELSLAGFSVTTCHLADDLKLTQEKLRACIHDSDVIITTGGVSVGEADFVKAAIESMGEITFWKVAMKPGKPITFGKVTDSGRTVPVLGLPGNPVSAFAGFHLFGLPFLFTLQGRKAFTPPVPSYPIKLDKPLSPKREEFLRVRLEEEEGRLILKPYSHQGSGVLSSVVYATGFARIPKDVTTEPMDSVRYLDFNRYR